MVTPEKYIGDYLTVTGPDAHQCTAVAHAFERDNNLPIVYGDAKDTYANAVAYERVPYRYGLVAPVNSVAVWDKSWGGGAGHTAFVTHSDANGFDAVSQNDPTGSKVISKHYKYSDAIIGFFYPKGDNMATDSLTKEEVIVAHHGFYFEDPPQSTIDYYVGKTNSQMLTDFEASPQRKEIETVWAAKDDNAQILQPGAYIVKGVK